METTEATNNENDINNENQSETAPMDPDSHPQPLEAATSNDDKLSENSLIEVDGEELKRQQEEESLANAEPTVENDADRQGQTIPTEEVPPVPEVTDEAETLPVEETPAQRQTSTTELEVADNTDEHSQNVVVNEMTSSNAAEEVTENSPPQVAETNEAVIEEQEVEQNPFITDDKSDEVTNQSAALLDGQKEKLEEEAVVEEAPPQIPELDESSETAIQEPDPTTGFVEQQKPLEEKEDENTSSQEGQPEPAILDSSIPAIKIEEVLTEDDQMRLEEENEAITGKTITQPESPLRRFHFVNFGADSAEPSEPPAEINLEEKSPHNSKRNSESELLKLKETTEDPETVENAAKSEEVGLPPENFVSTDTVKEEEEQPYCDTKVEEIKGTLDEPKISEPVAEPAAEPSVTNNEEKTKNEVENETFDELNAYQSVAPVNQEVVADIWSDEAELAVSNGKVVTAESTDTATASPREMPSSPSQSSTSPRNESPPTLDDPLRYSGGSYDGQPINEDDGERWLKTTIHGSPFIIDLRAIMPYKKFISFGGFTERKEAILVLTAAYLPLPSQPNYNYIINHLFCYVTSAIDLLAPNEYVIVYFHCFRSGADMPPLTFCNSFYSHLDFRLRKCAKAIYIIHSNAWVKSALSYLSTFKQFARRKLIYVPNLANLKALIPTEFMYFPEEVVAAEKDESKHGS